MIVREKPGEDHLKKIIYLMAEESGGIFNTINKTTLNYDPQKITFKNIKKIKDSIALWDFTDKEKQKIFSESLIYGHYPTAEYFLDSEEKTIIKKKNVDKIFKEVIFVNKYFFTDVFANDNEYLSMCKKIKGMTILKNNFYKKFISKLIKAGLNEEVFNGYFQINFSLINYLLY